MFAVLIFCHPLCINFRGIEQQKEKKRNMLLNWTHSKEISLALHYAYLISEPYMFIFYSGYTCAVHADCTLTYYLCIWNVFKDNICVIFSECLA